MIDLTKILEKAKEGLGIYNSRVARSPNASKELTGESKVVIETIITAVNEELKARDEAIPTVELNVLEERAVEPTDDNVIYDPNEDM